MLSWSHGNRREAGYTLIEVLVGVAILAVLSAMMSLTFSSTFRLVRTMEEEQGREHQARICLSLLTEELMMARKHPRFPWRTGNGEHDGQPADLLAFISAGHGRYHENAHETDLTRVLYARDGDRLARVSLRNLGGLVPEAIERIDLATGVVAFDLRYYDEALREWVDEWDGQSRKSLPRAVMIRLTLMNNRLESRSFIDWVVIPAQSL